MKKIVLVIVVLNMLGSLVACSGEMPATEPREPATEEPYRPTLSPRPDWLVRWLNEPVCQPPCWENITPGKTSFADALAIANRISGSEVSHVSDVTIRLNFNQYGANYFALLQSRRDVNIQEIDLDTKSTSLKLGEIVDRYGFPDEMIKFSSSYDQLASHWIDLLYYDLGMVITFDPLPGDPWNKVSLGPDIYIGTIAFYAPQLKYYFNAPQWTGAHVSPAIKLKGYGVYNLPDY